MRKLVIAAFIVASMTVSGGFAQGTNQTPNMSSSDIPNMGQAPQTANGIGRLDLRVFDENGNPVKGAYAKLESRRSDGFYCESWNGEKTGTDARGVSVLPPIHMGNLKLTVKAEGFKTQTLNINPADLGQPVRVTLARK